MLLGVDVGGTFTDAVLVAEDRGLYTAKVPTTPSAQSEGVLEAVRLVLAAAGARPEQVSRFAHGMTVATNALLEGNTARTALIATAGFEDVIELGRQNRPHLYRLCEAAPRAAGPAPSCASARASGSAPEGVLEALEPDHARELAVRRWRTPARRRWRCACCTPTPTPPTSSCSASRSASCSRSAALSLSSELVGTFREYERTATTALDASLSPLLSSYLGRLSREARAGGLPSRRSCSPRAG